jgi:hypothetical protein
MGLDTVELVMEIEEAFDISIPDDRASKMLTVGDVYEFILEKTADSTLKSSTCLSAAAETCALPRFVSFGNSSQNEIGSRNPINWATNLLAKS